MKWDQAKMEECTGCDIYGNCGVWDDSVEEHVNCGCSFNTDRCNDVMMYGSIQSLAQVS